MPIFGIFSLISSSSHDYLIYYLWFTFVALLAGVLLAVKPMTISRREFMNLTGSLMGGCALAMAKPSYIGKIARSLVEMSTLAEGQDGGRADNTENHDGGPDRRIPESSTTADLGENEISTIPDGEHTLDEIGYFNDKCYILDYKTD